VTSWRKEIEPTDLSGRDRDLLEKRALQVSVKPAAQDVDEALFWIAEFPLGDSQMAVPLESMRAALPLKGVTPVPLARSNVIGILRFQGQVITVLSLASLLGNPGWREDPQTLLVLEVGGGRLIAVDCEQIPKPAAIPLRLVEQARAQGSAKGPSFEVRTPDRRQVQILDLQRLFDRRTERRDEED
jgi:purine-binding chemotaxis protein CheW